VRECECADAGPHGLQAVAAAFAPPVASKPRVVSLPGGTAVSSIPAAPLPAAAAAGNVEDGATAADATETVKVSSLSDVERFPAFLRDALTSDKCMFRLCRQATGLPLQRTTLLDWVRLSARVAATQTEGAAAETAAPVAAVAQVKDLATILEEKRKKAAAEAERVAAGQLTKRVTTTHASPPKSCRWLSGGRGGASTPSTEACSSLGGTIAILPVHSC
jgi:hypothetical protein